MDFNKKRLLYLIVLFLLYVLNISGQTINLSGRVLSQKSQAPIEFANITLSKQDSILLEGTITDSIGNFEFKNLASDDYILSASCLGFETKKILIQNLVESAKIDIFLNETSLSLQEIVVSASSIISKVNQRIIFPTKLQLNHSANGMQLLSTMMIPGLNINPMSNTISSSNGGDIILQINSVSATSEEIKTLQPDQIKRIEYSDYAGIRYGYASKIINFIVARDSKGGVIGIDLMNSLNTLAGGDVFFAKFNKGRSEYSMNYIIAFQEFNNNNRTRVGNYNFINSSPLKREEISNGGKYSSQMHDIALAYNFQKNDSVFFNAKLKYGMTNNPHNDFKNSLKDNNADKGEIYDGNSQKIDAPTIDFYYEHGLKNKQKVYANIVGMYSKAESNRNYIEFGNIGTSFEERLGLTSNKYSLIAEGIFEKGFPNGILKFGVKHVQSFTDQVIRQTNILKFDLNQVESSIFSEWSYNKNNLSYNLGLRVNRTYFSNSSISREYYNFLPKAMFGYKFTENSFIRYDIEMSQTNPTLVELSNAEIRLDPYLSEQGNSSLRPYKNLINTIFYENKKGLFTLNVNLHHHYKRNPIMESKRETDKTFLIMPENMKDWNKYNAEAILKVGMIMDVLKFSFTGGFNYFDSRGKNYTHSHSNLYYKANLLAMYKKWMFIGQIQPFNESLYGETLTKDGNYHYLAVQYNTNNISLGIGAFNPFKNVSRTIMENKNSQAPFRRETFSNASQTVVITLTWNLIFGRSHNVSSKSINNQNIDYGIKESYK